MADGHTQRVREGTEVWNTYGPTEGTVVACAARLSGSEPVRIGLPLDGWRLAVADPATGQPVAWGEVGELVIGGVGVARYLDPEKDAVAFRPLAALGTERAYHTGDLVRADPEGLIYVGRADAQVKIRGYRIELSEIEAVLMELPGIGAAAVTTYEPLPGVVELVAYYTLEDREVLGRQAVDDHLRDRLPRHMVPAYLEELAAMPILPGGKADRRSLADAVTELPAVPAGPAGEPDAGEVPRAGTARYVTCGALQLLAFFALVVAGAAVLSFGFTWISATTGWADLYLRSLAFSAGGFFLVCALPIAAKWALVGR
jgi:acyl-coenzyme A synthetase/AMP-(fatty) acid ligase